MEGDGQSWGIIRLGNHFYPRPHMEGDRGREWRAGQAVYNFYPRPHMEGDVIRSPRRPTQT